MYKIKVEVELPYTKEEVESYAERQLTEGEYAEIMEQIAYDMQRKDEESFNDFDISEDMLKEALSNWID